MNNKIIFAVAFALTGVGLWWKNSSNQEKLPLIGIIQVIEHPALDQTRKGIQDELAAQGLRNMHEINWDYQLAQGNPALATQIAQKFIGENATVIVAIGTTVAQAALQTIQQSGHNIPLVFSSVTDPITAKLITSNKKPEKGITGVSNYVSALRQFNYFKQLLPNLKRLGIIYNPGEANSVALNEEMIKAAKEIDIEIIFATASRTSDVSAATQSLLDKVDAIFVNNDNTALASFDSIVAIAKLQNIPVLVSDLDCLSKGALAALGADQYALGRQTGKMIAHILKNPDATSSTVVEYPNVVRGEANEKVAAELKIVLTSNA